jgi:hypothetical protein
MDERALRAIALDQHGLVTRAQVLAADGSDRAIRHQLDVGRWTRARRGVYVIGAVERTWAQTAMAAVLEAGPGARLARRSAARAWNWVEHAGRLQIAVDGRRRVRIEHVEVHRPVELTAADGAVAGLLPVTSPIRTLIDLAPSQGADTMGTLLDAAIRDQGVDPAGVAERIVELAGRGRRVPVSLVEALSLRAPDHDPGRSALESRVIASLARAGLPLPVRQHRIERHDGRTAFIDLCYPTQRIAIEVDGWRVHGQRAAFDADRVRANELVVLGWSLLRFTSAMRDDQICATVARALTR